MHNRLLILFKQTVSTLIRVIWDHIDCSSDHKSTSVDDEANGISHEWREKSVNTYIIYVCCYLRSVSNVSRLSFQLIKL